MDNKDRPQKIIDKTRDNMENSTLIPANLATDKFELARQLWVLVYLQESKIVSVDLSINRANAVKKEFLANND